MAIDRRRFLALASASAAALAAPARAAARLDVVATTGMIADAARQIGGDLVEVRALMGPGVDPHSGQSLGYRHRTFGHRSASGSAPGLRRPGLSKS